MKLLNFLSPFSGGLFAGGLLIIPAILVGAAMFSIGKAYDRYKKGYDPTFAYLLAAVFFIAAIGSMLIMLNDR